MKSSQFAASFSSDGKMRAVATVAIAAFIAVVSTELHRENRFKLAAIFIFPATEEVISKFTEPLLTVRVDTFNRSTLESTAAVARQHQLLGSTGAHKLLQTYADLHNRYRLEEMDSLMVISGYKTILLRIVNTASSRNMHAYVNLDRFQAELALRNIMSSFLAAFMGIGLKYLVW